MEKPMFTLLICSIAAFAACNNTAKDSNNAGNTTQSTVTSTESTVTNTQGNTDSTTSTSAASGFYFACSGRHNGVPGYCVPFATYEEAVAEKEKHKKEYPNHTDVSASGGKCPF